MKKRQGSALISALFIMTLVAIVATAMTGQLQRQIQRLYVTTQHDQLYLAAQPVVFWAMDTLTYTLQTARAIDDQGKILDFPPEFTHLTPGIALQGRLIDLQGYFNLNNLQNMQNLLAFNQLIMAVSPSVEEEQRRVIINATFHWLDAQQPKRATPDEFAAIYSKKKPPYNPSYLPMQDVAEWRLVSGVTESFYQTMLPYVTVLPAITPINLNTASIPVLMSLGLGLTPSEAKKIVAMRRKKILQFEDVQPMLEKFDLSIEQIAFESNYFLCEAIATSGTQRITVQTVLQRYVDQKQRRHLRVLREKVF